MPRRFLQKLLQELKRVLTIKERQQGTAAIETDENEEHPGEAKTADNNETACQMNGRGDNSASSFAEEEPVITDWTTGDGVPQFPILDEGGWALYFTFFKDRESGEFYLIKNLWGNFSGS